MTEKQFRFQELEIWKRGAEISGKLFSLADELERRRLFRFAEQLRAATLSITNNIAEGSGSQSEADFANFLNIARHSVFEVANILLLLSQEGYLASLFLLRALSSLLRASLPHAASVPPSPQILALCASGSELRALCS